MAAVSLAAPAHVTLDDFYRIPDLPDGAELVDGEVVVAALASSDHGYVARALFRAMDTHASTTGVGECFGDGFGYELPVPARPHTLRVPDASFVRAERIPRPRVRGRAFALAPDVAAEVLSPSDTYPVVRAKLDDYLQAGTAAVWLVDPASRTIEVHAPGAPRRLLHVGDTLAGGEAFPGFTLALAPLFAVLDE